MVYLKKKKVDINGKPSKKELSSHKCWVCKYGEMILVGHQGKHYMLWCTRCGSMLFATEDAMHQSKQSYMTERGARLKWAWKMVEEIDKEKEAEA